MARAKKCLEEFNPWPPFVDVFSSVILVLLLFILVIIVNVAYYMQFNQKVNSASTVTSTSNNLIRGNDVTDMVTMKKVPKPSKEKGGNGSLFSGGKSQGNALVAAKDQTQKEQKIQKISQNEILIEFQSKDIFIGSNIKNSIHSFINSAKIEDPNAKIGISFANSTAIGSLTVAKQISIGRMINIKNLIKKQNYKLSDISLKIKNTIDAKYKHGYVKLKVMR